MDDFLNFTGEPPPSPEAPPATPPASPDPALSKLAEEVAALRGRLEATPQAPPPPALTAETLVGAIREARAQEQWAAAQQQQLAPPDFGVEDDELVEGAKLRTLLGQAANYGARQAMAGMTQAMQPIYQQLSQVAAVAPVLANLASDQARSAVKQSLATYNISAEEVDSLWPEAAQIVQQAQVPMQQKIQMAGNPEVMRTALLHVHLAKQKANPAPPPSLGAGQLQMGGGGRPAGPASATATQAAQAAANFWGLPSNAFNQDDLATIAAAGERRR